MKLRFYYVSVQGERGHRCIRADSHEVPSEENGRQLVLKLNDEVIASYHANAIRGWETKLEETDPMQAILDSAI